MLFLIVLDFVNMFYEIMSFQIFKVLSLQKMKSNAVSIFFNAVFSLCIYYSQVFPNLI